MKNKIIFLLLLFSNAIFCQKILEGKIINSNDVEGIHVLNIVNNKSTITNNYGEFKLLVKLNDTITISGLLYNTKTILITEGVLKMESLRIKLTPLVNMLETVYMGNKLTGNLSLDSKSIKTKIPIEISLTHSFKGLGKYKGFLKPDGQTSLPTKPLPGVDIIGLISLLIPKKKGVLIPKIKPLSFSKSDLLLYYGVDFFKKDLKILKEDEERFIQFSEFDQVVKNCLKNRDKFNLLDRLLILRKQFIVSK